MTNDQHLADLLGLDLTDPEVIAALAEQREIAAIRARVHEVLTRTGTSEGKLVAMLGITADKARASLAGERRWSTYELAVIATHGKTTVEWLCGEDGYDETADHSHRDAINAPLRPETIAALRERLASGDLPTLMVDDGPTPERDGYTIGVYLPPEATQADIDAIMTRVADAVHGRQYQGQWDPFVVGHAGDWLYVDHHPDQVHDYAAHVRERWNHGTAED